MHRYSILVLVATTAALLSTSTAGRLYKRNGYPYTHRPTAVTVSHYDTDILASAGHGDESSGGRYELSYADYKHQASPPSPPSPATHHHQLQHASSSSGSSKSGYSIGSGLRSIAQGSANQAYTAVANQHAAAKQAAFIAQNTLAQAASQAAATAQAALAGKQVILQELEQQAAEAQRSLSRELDQLNAAKVAAKLAQQTAKAAYNHVSVLTAAINNAKSVAEQAEQSANEVSNQLASQSSMVGQAKSRLEQLEEQLKQARIDYIATKEAATKAASSAAAAQVNASKAAAHATIELHESANQSSHSADDGDEAYDEHIDTTGLGHADDERH